MLLAVIVHRTVRSLPTKYSVIFDDISHHTPYSYTDTQTQQHCVQCGAVHHSVFAMYMRISGKALKLPTECESFILNCSKIGCIRCEGESLQECSTTERNAVPVNGTISPTDTLTHMHTHVVHDDDDDDETHQTLTPGTDGRAFGARARAFHHHEVVVSSARM